MKSLARAHSNIALVKYWGKRNIELNLPAVGSISITLDQLFTTSSVEFKAELQEDKLILNGSPASEKETVRVANFLDLIRTPAGIDTKAIIESENNFPTSAGLASSASAFAALAVAGSHAAGINLSALELSELARKGSGSAARSIFGGFAEMAVGKEPDGRDSTAYQLVEKDFWDLRILIVITSEEKKKTGSTDGMELSRETSPYYKSWITSSLNDIMEMRAAILSKDFDKMGDITEYSCLKMHALALASRPGLIYWNGTTLDLMHRIRALRSDSVPVYFTIDAGPQVKAICMAEHLTKVRESLADVPGVLRIIETGLGDGAQIIGE